MLSIFFLLQNKNLSQHYKNSILSSLSKLIYNPNTLNSFNNYTQNYTLYLNNKKYRFPLILNPYHQKMNSVQPSPYSTLGQPQV